MLNRGIKKGSFVVISDFHSCDWPIKKIKDYYLDEYETIYILGDCTDRGEKGDGTGGMDIMFQIKELTEKYPNRVFYLPGNHDSFFYDYAKNKSYVAEYNMFHNHGSQTIKDINRLRKQNPKKLQELIEWLEKLPLQREHYFNGKRYVLAHALFDEKLFKQFPNFSLKDYYNYDGDMGLYEYLLWFRKCNNDDYNPSRLPDKDSVMVVGHTPENNRLGVNLDLTNDKGETIKVVCVDAGICFGNDMLKYDGGDRPDRTKIISHQSTAPVPSGNNDVAVMKTQPREHTSLPKFTTSQKTPQTIFEKNILQLIASSKTIDDALLDFFKINLGFGQEKHPEIYEELRQPEVREYMSDLMLYYVTKDHESKEANKGYNNNVFRSIKDMFSKIALDYVIYCLMKRYRSRTQAALNIRGYFEEKDLDYITESFGRARTITSKFTQEDFKNVMLDNGYNNILEYINHVFPKKSKNNQ